MFVREHLLAESEPVHERLTVNSVRECLRTVRSLEGLLILRHKSQRTSNNNVETHLRIERRARVRNDRLVRPNVPHVWPPQSRTEPLVVGIEVELARIERRVVPVAILYRCPRMPNAVTLRKRVQ